MAALALDAGKRPLAHPASGHGQVIQVMLEDRAAADQLGASDAQILAGVLPEVEHYLPGISRQLQDCLVTRWAQAMPTVPVGRGDRLVGRAGHHAGGVIHRPRGLTLPCPLKPPCDAGVPACIRTWIRAGHLHRPLPGAP